MKKVVSFIILTTMILSMFSVVSYAETNTSDIRFDFLDGIEDATGSVDSATNKIDTFISSSGGIANIEGNHTYNVNGEKIEIHLPYVDLDEGGYYFYAKISYSFPVAAEASKGWSAVDYATTTQGSSRSAYTTILKDDNSKLQNWDGYKIIRIDTRNLSNTSKVHLRFTIKQTMPTGTYKANIDWAMFSKNSSLDESTSVIEFINSEDEVINLEQNGDITTAEIDNEVYDALVSGTINGLPEGITASLATGITNESYTSTVIEKDGYKILDIIATGNKRDDFVSRTYRIVLTTNATDYLPDVRLDFTSGLEGASGVSANVYTDNKIDSIITNENGEIVVTGVHTSGVYGEKVEVSLPYMEFGSEGGYYTYLKVKYEFPEVATSNQWSSVEYATQGSEKNDYATILKDDNSKLQDWEGYKIIRIDTSSLKNSNKVDLRFTIKQNIASGEYKVYIDWIVLSTSLDVPNKEVLKLDSKITRTVGKWTGTVVGELEHSEKTKETAMIFVGYDTVGEIIDIDLLEMEVVGSVNDVTSTFSTVSTSFTDDDITVVRLFLWENLDTLVPLLPAISDSVGGELELKTLITSFKGDAQNARGISWVTDTSLSNMVVRYAKSNEDFETTYNEADATFVEHENDFYYKADMTGLETGTEYVYCVGSPAYDMWSEFYSFKTEDSVEDEYSFVVFADTQGNKQSDYDIFKDTLDQAFDDAPEAKFMLALGDAVGKGYDTTQWEMYFNALKEYTPQIPMMSLVGNHETREDETTTYLDAGLEFKLYFNYPTDSAASIRENLASEKLNDYNQGALDNIEGSVYSFDYGDVHYIALNSGTDYSATNTLKFVTGQIEWLEEDLKNTDAKWIVLMIHQGVYPAKEERNMGFRELLEPIIDKYNVDLVLQGHDHMVARTYPMRNGEIVSTNSSKSIEKGEGTVYFIPGSAGYKRYDDLVSIPEYMYFVENTSSASPTYSIIKVTEQNIEVETKDNNGNVIDSFKIIDK